jgi:hypothetical protein
VKRVGTDVYVHVSNMQELPEVLREKELRAATLFYEQYVNYLGD